MKNTIKKMIQDYELETNDIKQAIYIIDDVMVNGDFEMGIRGNDHNVLINDEIGWDDLLKNGIVIVPENSTYISSDEIDSLNELGYERLPLDDNHIVGYR